MVEPIYREAGDDRLGRPAREPDIWLRAELYVSDNERDLQIGVAQARYQAPARALAVALAACMVLLVGGVVGVCFIPRLTPEVHCVALLALAGGVSTTTTIVLRKLLARVLG